MHHIIGKYIIRDWKLSDAPSLTKYANNKNVWLNLRDAFPHPYTLKNAEKFLSHVITVSPKTFFAIATQTEAIGSIGLTVGKDVHRFTAELGYWLAEPFWGQGIATLAVISITAFAIQELNLHRVYAEPYATNRASIQVLEKAGFVYEGRLRANAFKDGQVLDQFLYSFIATNDDQQGEQAQ